MNIFMHMSALTETEVELEERKSAGMGPRAGRLVEEGTVRRKLIFHDTQNWEVLAV